MEDRKIVELYWKRDENAIVETQNKYDHYCFAIANGIVHNNEDAEECVNDTYVGAWAAMPPHKPAILSTFLGKITRRLALKKVRAAMADKRGGGETPLALEEMEECIGSKGSLEEHLEEKELTEILNRFLEKLGSVERSVFVCRYWYFDSIADIAKRFGFTESKVKMMLLRTREKLQKNLEKEGVFCEI